MHNNVKFVQRDKDIQVWWEQLVFRFILGWAFVPFCMSWAWRSQKKLPPTPLRIISGTAITSVGKIFTDKRLYSVF